MLLSPPAGSAAPVQRLAATLYGYAFLDELVLLYPVYALLFSDTGLSTAEISSLFVIWSVTGLVLEVPSGVWADAVSRRLLLCLGPLLTAAGYALWTAVGSYWAFALGFVLWGIKGALQSGALEALVYEELEYLGAAGRYARTMGRARAAGMTAVMVATAAAGPVFAAGGYPAVGAASVLACLLTAVAGFLLPEHRPAGRQEAAEDAAPAGYPALAGSALGGSALGGYAATMRAAWAEVRDNRPVRSALVLVPAVTAIWGALEEYDVLLIRDTGVSVTLVPLLTLVIWAGVTLGGLLAGIGTRLAARTLAATLALAAIALATGAASGRPAGITLVAVAFCAFQMASVVADARLQERMDGTSRATVTSLAGLGTELATIVVFAAYAGASLAVGHRAVFAACAAPYLVVAFALARGDRGRRAFRVRTPAPVETTPNA